MWYVVDGGRQAYRSRRKERQGQQAAAASPSAFSSRSQGREDPAFAPPLRLLRLLRPLHPTPYIPSPYFVIPDEAQSAGTGDLGVVAPFRPVGSGADQPVGSEVM